MTGFSPGTDCYWDALLLGAIEDLVCHAPSNVILELFLCIEVLPVWFVWEQRWQMLWGPFPSPGHLQYKSPRTGLAHRCPTELPSTWAQVEAWQALTFSKQC